MQTVYRQSVKKFYMQTGASESAFVCQLCKNETLAVGKEHSSQDFSPLWK